MADTTIDELVLKIDVDMQDNIDRRINGLTRAIGKLDNMVKSIDLGRLSQYVETLNKVNVNLANLPTINSLSKSVKEIQNKLKTVEVKGSQKSTGGLSVKTDGTSNKKQIKDTNKELDKQKKKVEKSSIAWGKLFKSIGRIALYRAIRSILKSITQAISTGLSNIRSINSELDNSMNRLSQSGTTLKNTFAMAISPVIKGIEPIITRIADGIANIVNRIEEAKAAMSGASSYTRILTSDTKEYQQALKKTNGSLLEFDKFTSLNKKQYTGAKEEKVSISSEEGAAIYNQIQAIKLALEGVAGIIGFFIGLGLVNKIAKIAESMKTLTKGTEAAEAATKSLSATTKALAAISIFTLISGIVSLIANWKDMSNTAKVLVPVLSVLAGVIATIVALLTIAKGNWVKALSIGAIATGVGLSVGSTLSTMKFADGGIPQAGTLFYAGEAGAEAVYNTSSGQSGVVNIEQFTTAMYNALVRYGAAQNGNGGSGNVYIDSTKVGQLVEKSVYNEGVRVGHFARK